MRNLKSHDCLTAEKERELAILAANGNRKAKDELILSNIRFVKSFVKKYVGYGLDEEELFEEGIIGLCQAVEHYNPNKGARLITYASFWIRNAVLDAINESGARLRLSGEKSRKVIQLKKFMAEASTILADNKDCLEYACNRCNCSIAEARQLLLATAGKLSLDAPTDSENNTSLGLQLPDFQTASIEDEYIKKENNELLEEAMTSLKPEEQIVLKLHYGLSGKEPLPFSSIANKIGKSRARVHQIEKIAISRLQNKLLASGY